jgi:septum formation protein
VDALRISTLRHYGIQGRAGMFVEYLAGSCCGVMGLPLFEMANLLKRFDFPL